ncbi:MAG: hypothetical protein FWF57_05345 [Defluviitaleaceae bacterium]|nr:hypothetical protein [Defluviitaleaceae bacterium]
MLSLILTIILVLNYITPAISSELEIDTNFLSIYEDEDEDGNDHYINSFEFEGITYTIRFFENSIEDMFFYEYQNDVLVNRAVIYASQNDRLVQTTFHNLNSNLRNNEIVESVWHWRVEWNTNSIWGFFSFADLVHMHTLSPIYGGITNWSVSSW